VSEAISPTVASAGEPGGDGARGRSSRVSTARKLSLPKLSGQLGVGLCLVGLLLVFLGWNGAASRDRVPAQFPYLLSGGIAGLSLVVIGVGMIVVQNHRADRVALQGSMDRLREAMERGAAAPSQEIVNGHGVFAGRSSYHQPGCRLLEGRDDAELLGEADAVARGLTPCRICHREPLRANRA
jgi:hypothetical protein